MNLWERIRKLEGRRLASLDQGNPFDVANVRSDAVELFIHSTSKNRRIPRGQLESAWCELEQRRSLSLVDIRKSGHSEANPTYVIAILSALPGVTHSQHPLQLHLQAGASPSEATSHMEDLTPSTFEHLARRIMSKEFGVALDSGWIKDVPKEFDFVSPDRMVVGDAKFYTLVRGKSLPPAKFSVIAEHVWLLEKVEAPRRFLAFGNDRRVPEKWLDRYGHLVQNVEFYFLTDQGVLERLK